MSKMFGVLKEESESILKIKNISHDGKLPRGLLQGGKEEIRNALQRFESAAEADAQNEKRPARR